MVRMVINNYLTKKCRKMKYELRIGFGFGFKIEMPCLCMFALG